jgi:hypothetical protein
LQKAIAINDAANWHLQLGAALRLLITALSFHEVSEASRVVEPYVLAFIVSGSSLWQSQRL